MNASNIYESVESSRFNSGFIASLIDQALPALSVKVKRKYIIPC